MPVPKNNLRFNSYSKRAYQSAATNAARNDIPMLIAQQMPEEPFKGPLEVRFVFYVPRPKSVSKKSRPYPDVRPDNTNYIKQIEDCANKLLWEDDGQIVNTIAYKRYADDRDPGFTISIKKLRQ